MRKLIPFLLLAISFAQELPANKAIASAAPPAITDAKARELGVLRDKVDPALGKLQPLPAWSEYQKAMEDQKKANAEVDTAVAKVKATPEGKEYIKAADDYSLALREVFAGVDQAKWKLGPGYTWVAVAAPKAEVQSKKEAPPKGSK
jgi:hypothetical protein